MINTKHLSDRLVLEDGLNKKDKVVLDRKNISKLIKEIDPYRKNLLKIMDKRGLVVVVNNDTLITTYNR